MEAQYPSDHPYHWPTIGFPADLHAATVEDARAFFLRYYHPANASLVVAGDVDTAETIRLVEDLFGAIPHGAPVPTLSTPAPVPPARRLLLEDRVELARLYLAWPSPALYAAGDAELDLLADLVANGRTSRLYGRLIYERRVAVELAASQGSRELGGTFEIIASAAPGHTLQQLKIAIDEELARMIDEGPTEDELARGRAQAEASFVYRLQSLGGFGGKADQLNMYNVYHRDPDYFDRDLNGTLASRAMRFAVRPRTGSRRGRRFHSASSLSAVAIWRWPRPRL